MSKATWTYILMFVALIAGLWAIMRYGSTLRAPPNISGEWELEWTGGGDDSAQAPRRLRVDQSGRFLAATLGDGPKENVQLSGRLEPADGDGNGMRILLQSHDRRWRISGSVTGDGVLSGTTQAPYQGLWRARRERVDRGEDAPHPQTQPIKGG